MGTSLSRRAGGISALVAPWNKKMLRATLLSLALAAVVSILAVDAASSPCTDLQDLGFALSFGNRGPCKRTYRQISKPANELSLDLGPNRIDPKYNLGPNRIEPEYNPTFWRLINMLESLQQSHLGKRANEEVDEKKRSFPNIRLVPDNIGKPFPFYNTL